jgi:hypothetical protein
MKMCALYLSNFLAYPVHKNAQTPSQAANLRSFPRKWFGHGIAILPRYGIANTHLTAAMFSRASVLMGRESAHRSTLLRFGLQDRRSDLEMDRIPYPPASASDRRGTQRFRVNVPLTVLFEERTIAAYTQDLSNRGVYFYLDATQSAEIGSEFEFVVELPPEITLSTCCRIRCRGKMLRKEVPSPNLSGIAAEILDYSFLREAEAFN